MNRLLIKLENVPDAQFARVQAFKEHISIERYHKPEGARHFSCLSHEVLKYKDYPELEDIYTDGAWSAIGLAALVDIFATDCEEDQTEAPEIATGTPVN